MATYLRTIDQNNGTFAFEYSLDGQSIPSIAELMNENADEPFQFQGQLKGKTGPMKAENIPEMINRGGSVAAQATIDNTKIIIRFLKPDSVILVSADGNKETVDKLIGASDDNFDATYGMADNYQDYEFSSSENDSFSDPRGANYYENAYDNSIEDSPERKEEVVGIGEWLLTLVLLCIPIVGLVMLIVWLVSKQTKPSKKNFLKVYAILMAISLLLSMAITMIAGPALMNKLMSNSNATNPAESSQVIDVDALNVSNMENSNDTSNLLSSNSSSSSSSSSTNSDMLASNTNTNTNTTNQTTDDNSSLESSVQEGFSANANPFGDEQNSGNNSVENSALAVNTSIDGVNFLDIGDGKKIIVVTSTMQNIGTNETTPEKALKISAYQGQQPLSWVVETYDGYVPSTIKETASSGTAVTYQFAYYLDDTNQNDVHITIQNMQTEALLTDATFPLG